ncbi:hypothetical protein [Pararhodospirillum photometricum]|uniref:Uncharacterized protein n=1 Tax=Pararhodospirillum photometricum DSM 122 TaxID=1150469 RepID=H6SQL7_PARPM|nr:hypothetical protein [Pararhodospirillum photometricum]CCG07332.1 unnamed protein product [Pararhodospirillum photometricum DSM 122]
MTVGRPLLRRAYRGNRRAARYVARVWRDVWNLRRHDAVLWGLV